MDIRLINAQRQLPVPCSRLTQLARCAVRRLRIQTRGRLEVTFVSAQKMRQLNKRFTKHEGLTDVLSFHYRHEPIVGEILICPQAAWTYTHRQGPAYRQELARYVVHGLLHWLGYEDRTAAQRTDMRAREDQLLSHCG